MNLDTLPKSYPLNPKEEKVQFRDKHLMLVGWIKSDYSRECNALKEYCDKINQSNLEISEAI
ncbi:MAG: hypothetical protein N2V75_08510 [Methanophagales archaeon]|nr:hypothetical protein [Methanophagales archaeon]